MSPPKVGGELEPKAATTIVMIGNAVAAQMSMAEATEIFGCSERQVKRPKQGFERDDPSWVLHDNHGRTAESNAGGPAAASKRFNGHAPVREVCAGGSDRC